MFTPNESRALDQMLTSSPEEPDLPLDFQGEEITNEDLGWKTEYGFVPEESAKDYMTWLYGQSLPLSEW